MCWWNNNNLHLINNLFFIFLLITVQNLPEIAECTKQKKEWDQAKFKNYMFIKLKCMCLTDIATS